MCGRYLFTSPPEALRHVFGVTGPLPNLRARYNIAPTQEIVIVRADGGGRAAALVRWGLIPFWAKDRSIASRLINARGETVADKPAFRDSFRKRRCLIPADGFYEWRKLDGAKQPVLVTMRSGAPFAFAGLWSDWTDRDAGERVETATIVTTAANALLKPVHDRMPVVLAPKDYDRWLDPAAGDARDLLKPYPADEMAYRPISTRVNAVRNDDPEVIAPISP